MAFFARDVMSGRLPGPYSGRRAEHFARCALLPDEEFAALERFPEAVLAEYFNVPLEQVAEKRVDLEAATQLAKLETGPLLR
jgi:Zn-dependent peptidase ImmA (M78 family)